MKKYLIGFIVVLISVIPILTVKASSNDTITFQDGSNTVTLKSPSYYDKKYGFVIKRCYYGCSYYYSIADTPLGYSTNYAIFSNYDNYSNTTFFIKTGANINTPFSEFQERNEGYGINDNSPILWSNYDVPEINWQDDVKESTGNIVHACNAEDCINLNGNFNKTYSSNDYSKIEFDFNNFSIFDEGFQFKLDLDVKQQLPDNTEGFPFSSPYFEFNYSVYSVIDGNISLGTKTYTDIVYVSDFSSTDYHYQIDKVYNDLTKKWHFLENGEIFYTSREIENGDRFYKTIKLVVPLDSDFSSHINISFESNHRYQLIEHEKSSLDNNLVSADLTGKRGAILVSKDINNSYSSTFKVDGRFYLETRDSISDKDFNVEKVYTYGFCDALLHDKENYHCSLSNKFSLNFGQDNPYRVLHFTNLESDTNATSIIYYDATKFELYIIEKNDSQIIIKDPVTGDDIFFDNDVFEENSGAKVDIEYLVSLIKDFLDKNENATTLVRAIFGSFFNNMPEELYQGIVMISFILFIIVIVVIAGWK